MAYATTAELKAYLGISGTSDDTLLAALITRAQAAIDSYCGRTFQAASGTRYYDWRDVDGDTLYLDADLVSVTTLTNGDGTEIAETEYVLEPRNGTPKYAIRLLSTSAWSVGVDEEIAVAGQWGWSESPPADIVQATIRLAAYMYRQKDATTFDATAFTDVGVMTIPQGIPKDVLALLQPYRRLL